MKIRPLPTFVSYALLLACNAAEDGSGDSAAPAVPAAPAPPGEPQAPAATSSATRTVVTGLPTPVHTNIAELAMIDRVDVANEASELAHKYSVKEPTFVGSQQFDIAAANVSYVEDGRAMKASEAFQIKVVPHEENLLIRAFDTFAKDQKVRVLLQGRAAGEWTLPDNESTRYGEAVFTIPASTVRDQTRLDVVLEYVSGVPDINSFVYWVYAKADQKLEAPVNTKLSGLALTDRIDIANESDEAEHHYIVDQPTYAGTQQFEWPANGLPFFENGRANKSFESFRMKVTPNKDHVLVKAYDTFAKNQIVRVLVNGTTVGDWALEDGEKRYGESSFRIPARVIGSQKEVEIRVEHLSGIDCNSFYYWLFADSVTRNG